MTAREFVRSWMLRFDDLSAISTFYSFSKSLSLARYSDFSVDVAEGFRKYRKMNRMARSALGGSVWRELQGL